jgi:hypothetical protein
MNGDENGYGKKQESDRSQNSPLSPLLLKVIVVRSSTRNLCSELDPLSAVSTLGNCRVRS